MTERDGAPAARAVLQQCLQARLQVKPAEEHSEAQFVQVRTPERFTVSICCMFTGLHYDVEMHRGAAPCNDGINELK